MINESRASTTQNIYNDVVDEWALFWESKGVEDPAQVTTAKVYRYIQYLNDASCTKRKPRNKLRIPADAGDAVKGVKAGTMSTHLSALTALFHTQRDVGRRTDASMLDQAAVACGRSLANTLVQYCSRCSNFGFKSDNCQIVRT